MELPPARLFARPAKGGFPYRAANVTKGERVKVPL